MLAQVFFRYFGTFFCLCVSSHFVYQGFFGPNGYFVIEYQLKPRLRFLQKEKDQIIKKRKRLAKKVSLLTYEIDPDLLEQYEWRSLGRIPKGKNGVLLLDPDVKKVS
jgi:hypothetical protein